MSDSTVARHTRDHRSVLARLERRALVFIAERLPSRATPDQLSALGLASMVAAGCAFAAMRVNPLAAIVVVVALGLNWFGDSLDGTLARVRGQERPRYGYYLDHVIDLAGTTALFVGIVASGAIHPVVGVALLAAFLLASAETYLATHALGVFRLSFMRIGPTELRIVLAVGALRLMRGAWIVLPLVGDVRLFDVGGIVGIAGLLAVFAVSSVRNIRTLYAAERLRRASES